MIPYKILRTNIMRIVWLTERRMTNFILELKGSSVLVFLKIIYIKPCRVSIEYCIKFKEKVIINWVLEENPTRYGISCHCTSNHSIYNLKHHQHFFCNLYSFQGTHYAVFNFHIICVTNHVGVFSVFTKLHLLYQKVLVTSILVWW